MINAEKTNTCHYRAGHDNPVNRSPGQARRGQLKQDLRGQLNQTRRGQKNTQKTKAFTLVELIIVITILAILRTIGFMSFQTYTADARDSNRMTTLRTIGNGLDMYQLKNIYLPTPDEKLLTTLDASGNTISYQGYVGTTIQKAIKMTNDTIDPKDNTYYTYSTNGAKTKYQLLALLENNLNLAYNENVNKNNILNQTYARIDYTTRFPYSVGQKVGIFFTGTTNQPYQETLRAQTGTLALSGITTQMKVMFSNARVTSSGTIIATGSSLPEIIVTETQSVATSQQEETPRANTCTSWTYNTGACTIDGTAPLTIATSSPNGCTGGTPLTTTSCTYNCPTGYILVPGNSTFSTTDFCVAKYEMKNVGGVATSQSALTPWVSITQPRAITACNNLGAGYHLITNNEWMTIARNIEANSQNWANGIVGSLVSVGGGLYRGNVNLNDSASCGSNTVLDGDTRGTYCDNGSGRNKRMHKLSNGNDIWDISGNVREHVNGTNNKSSTDGVVANGNACSDTAWHSWNSANDGSSSCTFTNTSPTFYSKANQGPAGDYNALNGVGRIYSSTRANRIFLRGGHWNTTDHAGVFFLALDLASTHAPTSLGFRCAF